LKLFQLFLS